MRVVESRSTFPLEGALQALAHGEHLCSIYENQLDDSELLIPFLRIGLERGEKCVCIAQEGREGHLEQALTTAGIDVAAALASKALVLMSPGRVYLKGDSFDPYRMFTFWKDLSSRAREEGFSRLRGACNMHWILRGAPGTQPWLAYERHLSDLAADSQCLLLCQYDRSSFGAQHLLEVIRTHPRVIHRGTVADNIYYRPSELDSQADAPEFESLLNDLRKREHANYLLREQRAEDERRSERATQSQLVRVSRLTTLGELTAAIAHEVNQPLTAIIAHAGAARRWLSGDFPNVVSAAAAIDGITADARRASQVIARIRALARKADNHRDMLDLNEMLAETLVLVDAELRANSVTLRTAFEPALPRIFGDRVQLQQVALNLIVNAVEAIAALAQGSRELVIRTFLNERQEVQVAVQDSGVGLPEENLQMIFEPFYTTKLHGMGIGLSISRTIILAHNGRLWAQQNTDAPGITVHFTLPSREDVATETGPGGAPP